MSRMQSEYLHDVCASDVNNWDHKIFIQTKTFIFCTIYMFNMNFVILIEIRSVYYYSIVINIYFTLYNLLIGYFSMLSYIQNKYVNFCVGQLMQLEFIVYDDSVQQNTLGISVYINSQLTQHGDFFYLPSQLYEDTASGPPF